MRPRPAILVFPAALCVCLVATFVGARPSGGSEPDPPTPTAPKLERSEDALTLRVPAEQVRAGTVYHVLTGRENQVTFTSDAPLERFEGTTNGVIGYAVVAPPAGDAAGDEQQADRPVFPEVIAGEFHCAVDAIRTGIPLRDRHLAGRNWLDAKSHPDIVFRLKRIENIETVASSPAKQVFRADIVGSMEVKGRAVELRVAGATLTFLEESEASKAIAPGDLLRIECAYTVHVRDHGVDHSILGRKVAEDITIEQKLYLSTVAPKRDDDAGEPSAD